MKRRSKIVVFVATLIFLCVLYVFFAAQHFGKNIGFSREWVLDINDAAVIQKRQDEKIPFRMGKTIGYFSPDGDLLQKTDFSFKATISPSFSATYESNSSSFVLKDNENRDVVEINEKGFPFIQENRCYVFLPGGNSVAQFDAKTGEKKWSYSSFSPITAFQSVENANAIGFADGEIVCLNGDGTKQTSFYPGGSDNEIIINAGISSDGSYVAAICGIDKQRIILAQISNSQSKIIFHRYLSGNLRDRAFVKFSKNGETVFFSSPNGLGIIDVASQKMREISLTGKIVDTVEIDGTNISALLLKKNDKFGIVFIENFSGLVGSFDFKAQNAFIASSEKKLFVGCDNQISALEILVK